MGLKERSISPPKHHTVQPPSGGPSGFLLPQDCGGFGIRDEGLGTELTRPRRERRAGAGQERTASDGGSRRHAGLGKKGPAGGPRPPRVPGSSCASTSRRRKCCVAHFRVLSGRRRRRRRASLVSGLPPPPPSPESGATSPPWPASKVGLGLGPRGLGGRPERGARVPPGPHTPPPRAGRAPRGPCAGG